MRSAISSVTCSFGLLFVSACSPSAGSGGTSDSNTQQRDPAQMTPTPPAPDGGIPAQPAADAGCTDCKTQNVGAGGPGFDLTMNPNDSVVVDADGSLVVSRQSSAPGESFIWISDTGARPPAVSKVDTRTLREVARYIVGAEDPSRTSVSLTGDAYVSSREGKAVTKISVLGSKCPDTNGDGMITTSTGPNDVLPWGRDDCVLWTRKFDHEVRGVAAQDVLGQTMVEPQLDGPPKVTISKEKHFVWVGAATPNDNSTATAYKLDGDTGQILITTPMPRGAYGFALDGRGILWLTGGAYWQGGLAFIDTNRCLDNASCSAAPCRMTCSTTSCPATCDGAIKADINLDPSDTYGITVDCQQRVWLGGGNVKRYDPSAAVNQRLVVSDADHYVAGIAADARGFIWGAAGGSILRMDAATLQQSHLIDAGGNTHGVAIDVDGKVWGITRGDSAHVITPGAALTANTLQANAVRGLDSPYTYSDMTGVQLLLASGGKPGTYQQLFEGCKEGATTWRNFEWNVETPQGTWVVFQVRSADTLPALEAAAWLPLAGSPSTLTSTALADTLKASATPPGRYTEIRAEMYESRGAGARKCGVEDKSQSPRIKSFGVTYSCVPGGPI